VLHLEPRIDLQEEEGAGPVEQELCGAGSDVARRPTESQRGVAEAGAKRFIDRRRRRLLDDLLVPPLERAIALAEVHAVPLSVEEHLDLDVAWPFQVALEDEPCVAERDGRLSACLSYRLEEGIRCPHRVHPFPATAGARLDQDRVADALRLGTQRAVALVIPVVSRKDGDPERRGEPAAGRLVAERAHRLGRRTEPPQVGRHHALREPGLLRQEPVPGMDRIGTRPSRCLEHCVGIQIGRPERHDLVGLACPPCSCVIAGHERQAGDAEIAAGPGDAHDQLAAVGDEESLDGGIRRTRRLERLAGSGRGRPWLERARIDLQARSHAHAREPAFAKPSLHRASRHAEAPRRLPRPDGPAQRASMPACALTTRMSGSSRRVSTSTAPVGCSLGYQRARSAAARGSVGSLA
jgi:hypothetical protein